MNKEKHHADYGGGSLGRKGPSLKNKYGSGNRLLMVRRKKKAKTRHQLRPKRPTPEKKVQVLK